MSNYTGVIIEESLADTSVLKKVKILGTKVEHVTERHKTPWLTQWTLHTIEVPENEAQSIAEEISKMLDYSHRGTWYADFRNDARHYIIYKDKIFFIDRTSKEQYKAAKQYGISLGIPEYQVDFHPDSEEWQR